jgi:hypothetical protein
MATEIGAGAWRRRGAALMVLLALAGCGTAPDVRREGALATRAAAAPAVVTERLALPARIGLARLSHGRPAAVPGAERARWAGALAEVNRHLLYPIRLVPLPPPVLPDAAQGQPAPDAVEALLARAAGAGLDAVLVYALSTRAEDDRLAAALTELPLVGGVVPGTAATEGHGTALAQLLDPVTGAVIGTASARMTDRTLSSIRQSEGDPQAVANLADYAMLHLLVPRVEDLLVTAVSGSL